MACSVSPSFLSSMQAWRATNAAVEVQATGSRFAILFSEFPSPSFFAGHSHSMSNAPRGSPGLSLSSLRADRGTSLIRSAISEGGGVEGPLNGSATYAASSRGDSDSDGSQKPVEEDNKGSKGAAPSGLDALDEQLRFFASASDFKEDTDSVREESNGAGKRPEEAAALDDEQLLYLASTNRALRPVEMQAAEAERSRRSSREGDSPREKKEIFPDLDEGFLVFAAGVLLVTSIITNVLYKSANKFFPTSAPLQETSEVLQGMEKRSKDAVDAPRLQERSQSVDDYWRERLTKQ
eukprot:TRINITY_DN1257_c0_g2_i1.p1 TRINITY_DN1257_c0_g2~~TRINITY_DN1257_c0_g2_i1.p1  ORF type:complete len:294 (-),score=63.65 TRINITY_DN1257_c0_g2_i1:411-1292(-)